MEAVYPDEGLVELIDRMTNTTMHVHLFTNDLTPDEDTVLADMTEAAWTGYAAQDVDPGDWTLKGVANHQGYALANPVEFDNGSGVDQDAYGYYITDSGDSMLLQAVRFDSPPSTKPDGESWTVFPTWGDDSQYPE
jgi:hypothetical protein